VTAASLRHSPFIILNKISITANKIIVPEANAITNHAIISIHALRILAPVPGLEPERTVLEAVMLAITSYRYFHGPKMY
jgi:hypothetical protein